MEDSLDYCRAFHTSNPSCWFLLQTWESDCSKLSIFTLVHTLRLSLIVQTSQISIQSLELKTQRTARIECGLCCHSTLTLSKRDGVSNSRMELPFLLLTSLSSANLALPMGLTRYLLVFFTPTPTLPLRNTKQLWFRLTASQVQFKDLWNGPQLQTSNLVRS